MAAAFLFGLAMSGRADNAGIDLPWDQAEAIDLAGLGRLREILPIAAGPVIADRGCVRRAGADPPSPAPGLQRLI